MLALVDNKTHVVLDLLPDDEDIFLTEFGLSGPSTTMDVNSKTHTLYEVEQPDWWLGGGIHTLDGGKWGVVDNELFEIVKSVWLEKFAIILKRTAHETLSQTDWFFTRQLETGKKVPAWVGPLRSFVREQVSNAEEKIKSASTNREAFECFCKAMKEINTKNRSAKNDRI